MDKKNNSGMVNIGIREGKSVGPKVHHYVAPDTTRLSYCGHLLKSSCWTLIIPGMRICKKCEKIKREYNQKLEKKSANALSKLKHPQPN